MEALDDLEVWKRACQFSVEIYRHIAECKDYGYRDQLGRSALSVASNIAEGYTRKIPRERSYFLGVAKESCAEVWTQIYIGMDAGLIPKEYGASLSDEVKQISKMIYGLIAHFEEGHN